MISRLLEQLEKNKKRKVIFVKKSTTLLQSHCCSLNGKKMASKRRKGIIFKIGEKKSLVLKNIWNNLYLKIVPLPEQLEKKLKKQIILH